MPWLNENRIIISYGIYIRNWKMYVIENLHARMIIWIFIYILIKNIEQSKQLFVNISNI